jgi:DNA-binding beta-propeller fold protein YncE
MFAIALPSGQPIKVGDPVSADQQMVLSPSCANGLVYSPSRGSGLLISGLPSASRAQAITMSASGPLAGAAVSDSGAILFAVAKSDGTTSLEILSAAGAPQTLSASLQKVGGMAFLPGADSAVIADSAASTVYLGRQLSSGPSFTAIGASAQGVSNPRAVAASADGHFAFVANGAGNTLLRIDLNSNAAPIPIACSCSPTELIPLAGNAGFQITDPAAGVIFALNGDEQTPRTVFIPTDKAGVATGGAQ